MQLWVHTGDRGPSLVNGLGWIIGMDRLRIHALLPLLSVHHGISHLIPSPLRYHYRTQ
jgi:hypothetical protein